MAPKSQLEIIVWEKNLVLWMEKEGVICCRNLHAEILEICTRKFKKFAHRIFKILHTTHTEFF